MASRGYFAALQIPLRSGRLFDAHDASGPPVVIISQAAAERAIALLALLRAAGLKAFSTTEDTEDTEVKQ